MPALGFGTWALRGETCRRSVRAALDLGYRHVDTAEMYDNHREVGDGIRRAEVDREEVFLVTKLGRSNLRAPAVKRALEQGLGALQTEYVDLLLIHWPNAAVPLEETLGAMAEMREAGKVRHVGVSNFNVELLEAAVEAAPVPIFCNQVEYHPYLSQEPVLDCCREHDVLVIGYCPLARARVFDDPVLRRIGRNHDRSGGQVALRWLLQQTNVGAIPRSGDEGHIRHNFDIFDFELSDEEMETVFELARGERLVGSAGGADVDWDT
ncbi:MAG: aldo/keto reductase [Planctomycetota bacterium]